MSAPTSTKLRIAIVGGGIGGLALSVALNKLGLKDLVDVNVYESTAKLTQVGAGITFWPRGWEIMKDMGLEEALVAKLPSDQEKPTLDKLRLCASIRKSNQKQGTPIVEVFRPGGSAQYHRADVQSILLDHIGHTIIHLDHRLSTYRETENGLVLEFTNGKTVACDLLIGADGLNSAVRRTLIAEGQNWTEEEKTQNARPLWIGAYTYRYLVDADRIRETSPNSTALTKMTVYCGKNKSIITYPIRQGQIINVGLLVTYPGKEGTYVDGPPVQDCTADDVAPLFKNWEDDVQALLQHILKPTRWAIQYVKPLATYTSASQRVLLLGDAAHATAPYFANGAGLAIESAYVLAKIICKEVNDRQSDADVTRIARLYDEIRQPHCNAAAAISLELGKQYQFNYKGFEDYGDGEDVPSERVPELAKVMEEGFSWTTSSVMPDVQRAMDMLDS